MKRGRRHGEYVNPRDERGWMIPREGTTRGKVYDALCEGLSWADIGMDRRCFNTHKQSIVGWTKVYAWRRTSELREAA